MVTILTILVEQVTMISKPLLFAKIALTESAQHLKLQLIDTSN